MKLSLPHQILLATLLLPSISLVANAQNHGFKYPQPNRKGDYTSLLSTHEDRTKTPHLVWKVVSNNLSCRSQAGMNYSMIHLLSKGDNISIVGKAKTYQDKQGKPWLYISKDGTPESVNIRCFVRANSQFIEPIPYSTQY